MAAGVKHLALGTKAATNNEEETVLHYAAKTGQLEAVQWLHEHYRRRGKAPGVDLHDTDCYGSGLLHFASAGGSHELVMWLKDQGLSVEKKDKHGSRGGDGEQSKKKKKQPKDLKAIFRTLSAKWESEDDSDDDDLVH